MKSFCPGRLGEIAFEAVYTVRFVIGGHGEVVGLEHFQTEAANEMPRMEDVLVGADASALDDRLMAELTRWTVNDRCQGPIGVSTTVQQRAEARRNRYRHLFDHDVLQIAHPSRNLLQPSLLVKVLNEVRRRFAERHPFRFQVLVQRFHLLDVLNWHLFALLLEELQ